MAHSTASFLDADDLQAALEGQCQTEFVVTGRGRCRARLVQICLARLSLLSVEECQARVVFLRPPANQVVILVSLDREASQSWAGIALESRDILTLRSISGVHGRAVGQCRFAATCCSAAYLVRIGRRLIGPTFVLPPGIVRWRPAPNLLRSLKVLFRAAIEVTASRPSAPTRPDAAPGLEQ